MSNIRRVSAVLGWLVVLTSVLALVAIYDEGTGVILGTLGEHLRGWLNGFLGRSRDGLVVLSFIIGAILIRGKHLLARVSATFFASLSVVLVSEFLYSGREGLQSFGAHFYSEISRSSGLVGVFTVATLSAVLSLFLFIPPTLREKLSQLFGKGEAKPIEASNTTLNDTPSEAGEIEQSPSEDSLEDEKIH